MMYVWRSELFKNWGLGYIIVEGDDEDDARLKAIGYMLQYIMEENSYVKFYMEYSDKEFEEDIIEEWNTFLKDISAKPEEKTHIFINGSE